MIYMIWCEDINHGIGKNNHLPWRIKEELQHFKNTTLNQTLVCGRKTMESMNNKPLVGRKHLVLTRSSNYHPHPEIKIYHDHLKIIDEYKNKDLYIIGGKEIYNLFMPYANVLIITTLNDSYDCDLFFNPDLTNFQKTKTRIYKLFTINWYNRK